MQRPEIRERTLSDSRAIELLYPQAIPDENLLPLVRDLLKDSSLTTSLVGVLDGQIDEFPPPDDFPELLSKFAEQLG